MIKLNWKWVFLGYVLAILLALTWKARYVLDAKLSNQTYQTIADIVRDETALYQRDIDVLTEALRLLDSDIPWAQNNNEYCILGEPITLYCAVAIAAKQHHAPLVNDAAFLQRLVVSIGDSLGTGLTTPIRSKSAVRLLFEFNNHPDSNRQLVSGALRRAANRGS
ncbi:MAG: hypothetical protein AAF351_10070 [Pseudomonadota bacterium]